MKRRQFVQGMGAATLAWQVTPEAQAFANERKTMPLDAFANGGLLRAPQLSPDGKQLLVMIQTGDATQLVTRDLANGTTQGVLQTDNLEYSIKWARWKTNQRLLVSLQYPSIPAPSSRTPRIELGESRLLAVNADGSQVMYMVKARRGGGRQATRQPGQQDLVTDFLHDDPEHVLMMLPDDESSHAIYKVNIHSAERTLHQAPSSKGWYQVQDENHKARVAVESQGFSASTTLWVCDPDGSRWRVLAVNKGPYDEGLISPLGFGLDPNILYVRARFNGRLALHTMDLREETPRLTLKLADPTMDLIGELVRDARREVVGISSWDYGTNRARLYWDPGYKELQDQLDAALPNHHNRVIDVSRNGERYLLLSAVPGQPPALMLGDFKTGSLKPMGSFFPDLDAHRIALKQPLVIKARDGLELHTFLTVPLDTKPEKLPLVVLPHGGPDNTLDTGAFDPMVAFIADRGYAVLQVNYRGSLGYGWKHLSAGLRRAGLEPQNDVTDGIRKLVADGIVDPARVAIVGTGFGGYMALNGVTQDPELYRGAFAISPISNLLDAVNDWRLWGGRESVRGLIGDFRDDAEQLRATSPVFHVDRIKVPVVLVHGKLDRQIDFDQSVQMDAALTKADKAHKFIVFDKGDNTMTHRPYRQKLYAELESFLQSTLGSGAT